MSDLIQERIAGRIRTARAERGLSQKELSERIGVASQQVFKYESAKNQVTAGRLARIAQVLDFPLSYFFENIDLPGVPLLKISPGRIRLLRTYDKLDPANQVLLNSIARSLAEAARQKPITV
jgi:transcriptional regulator with XRE-family HTH domain